MTVNKQKKCYVFCGKTVYKLGFCCTVNILYVLITINAYSFSLIGVLNYWYIFWRKDLFFCTKYSMIWILETLPRLPTVFRWSLFSEILYLKLFCPKPITYLIEIIIFFFLLQVSSVLIVGWDAVKSKNSIFNLVFKKFW